MSETSETRGAAGARWAGGEMAGAFSSESEPKQDSDAAPENDAQGGLERDSRTAFSRKLRALLLGRSRAVMVGVGVVCVGVVLAAWLVDEGEVVRLLTIDAQLHQQETEVWIVDLDSGSYLRSSAPDSAWVARLRANPVVDLIRHGSQRQYRAVFVDDEAIREELNRAMERKYGFADRLWGRMRDRSSAIAIRLQSLDVQGDALAND